MNAGVKGALDLTDAELRHDVEEEEGCRRR
jgi:hypothetical protein